MRKHSSFRRHGAFVGLALGAYLAGASAAHAEVTLLDKDGWSFFTDGRINTFFTYGIGDAFPSPSANPNLAADGGPGPDHQLVGGDGSLFNAGYQTSQNGADGKYRTQRMRSGFLGNVLAFGVKRQISETTSVRAYIGLWGTVQSFARDRNQDSGLSASKGFDVRYGNLSLDGAFGSLIAGRQDGIFGGISTEIDFLYGHNFGLGLPCLDTYYPTCGHIGTGALGPGNGAGFVYITPSLAGLKLKVGLYDPVRLLGFLERVPWPRPEAQLTFERRLSPGLMFKLAAEGMYQFIAERLGIHESNVWGMGGGARVEAGPLRLGVSAFRGKGLGTYVALQNSPAVFNGAVFNDKGEALLRYFTGLYAQTALVFGRSQISAGLGRIIDEQLPEDKVDAGLSNLKSQTGASLAFYYHVTPEFVLGVDYFRFLTDWWGAPNSKYDDADPSKVVVLGGPPIKPEHQLVHFINTGATYHW